jgi:cell division transport system permease protein
MAILVGIEFYLVFDRITKSYEEGLRNKYSILIIAHDKMKLEYLQSLNSQIASIEEVKKDKIVNEISKGLKASSKRNLSKLLPTFYNTKLKSYLSKKEIYKVKTDLEKSNKIKRVETFDSTHNSTYKLFIFLKLIFKLFIFFISIVSFFLIIKQMEVWSLNHKERMRIMEIFGAPLFLRSAVMYRLAIFDTILATIFVSSIFIHLKENWVENSKIEILIKNRELIFQTSDIFIMLLISIPLVVISVFLVASNIKVEN